MTKKEPILISEAITHWTKELELERKVISLRRVIIIMGIIILFDWFTIILLIVR